MELQILNTTKELTNVLQQSQLPLGVALLIMKDLVHDLQDMFDNATEMQQAKLDQQKEESEDGMADS